MWYERHSFVCMRAYCGQQSDCHSKIIFRLCQRRHIRFCSVSKIYTIRSAPKCETEAKTLAGLSLAPLSDCKSCICPQNARLCYFRALRASSTGGHGERRANGHWIAWAMNKRKARTSISPTHHFMCKVNAIRVFFYRLYYQRVALQDFADSDEKAKGNLLVRGRSTPSLPTTTE